MRTKIVAFEQDCQPIKSPKDTLWTSPFISFQPRYPLNTRNLDWRKECATLKQRGIKIYSVQALNRSISTDFYRDMAALTDGFHLFLDQFSSIVNFMMAICYREQGLDQLQLYEDEVSLDREKF